MANPVADALKNAPKSDPATLVAPGETPPPGSPAVPTESQPAGPLQKAIAAGHALNASPSSPAATQGPMGPHAPLPGTMPQPVLNQPEAPPVPAAGNEALPGPRTGKVVPFIGQQAGTETGSGEVPPPPLLQTPGRIYNDAQPYPFGQAFAKSVLDGVGPVWAALRSGDMYAEASKFAPDPAYHWSNDPQVQSRPNMATAVMGSRSAQETRYILRQIDSWSEENRRLAQNGVITDAGYGAGMLLDPMNWVGVGELELPVKMGLRARVAYGIQKTAPTFIAGEAVEQSVASGLDPTRPNGSWAGGMLAALGTGLFLGIARGPLAGTKELTEGTQRLANETNTIDPLDPNATHPPPDGERTPAAPGEAAAPDPLADWNKLSLTDKLSELSHISADKGGPMTLDQWNAMSLPEQLQKLTGMDFYKSKPKPAEGAPVVDKTAAGGPGASMANFDPINKPKDFDRLFHELTGKETIYGQLSDEISTAGAAGIAQVMPDTARGIAKDLGETRLRLVNKDGSVSVLSPDSMSNKEIQAWLQQAGEGRTVLSGMSSVADGATIQRQANGSFAIIGKDGTREAGSLGADFASKDAAIAAAQKWDHRVQVTEEPGMTNSERYGRIYLKQMLDQFHDPTLALAAYNGGPGHVQSWIDQFGDPRKGEISWNDFIDAIPYKETREYVTDIRKKLGVEAPEAPNAQRLAATGAGDTSSLASGDVTSPKTAPKDIPADRAVFLGADGKPVVNHADAVAVRVAPEKYNIGDISLLNDAGEHVGGAPLAEGTPAVHTSVATFLNLEGKPVADPAQASHVLFGNDVRPYNHFDYHDASGAKMASGEGAAFLRPLEGDEQPFIPRDAQGRVVGGVINFLWKHRNYLAKEAVDWGIEVPLTTMGRAHADKQLQEERVVLGGSVGSRQAPGRARPGYAGPGRATYKIAHKLQGQTIKSAYGLEKVKVSPNLRLANAPFETAREGLEKLTEAGWTLNKHAHGEAAAQPSVFAKRKALQGQANQALQDTLAQYWNYVQRVGGKAPNPFEKIKTSIWGSSGIMSLAQFYEEVGKAKRYAGTGDAHGLLPEAIAAAAVYDKRIYKPMAKRIDDSGVMIQPLQEELAAKRRIQQGYYNRGLIAKGDAMAKEINQLDAGIRSETKKRAAGGTYREDYLQRVYDQRALAANGDAFKRILEEHGHSPTEAQGILDTLRRAQPYTPLSNDAIGRAGALHHRALAHIPDKALENFLVHDINVTTQTYVRTVGSDIGRAENFPGDMNLEKHIQNIKDEASQLIAQAKSPKERQALGKLADQAVQDTRDLRDMERGTIGLPADPQRFVSRGIRIAKQWNALTQLTGFVSALPDLARIPMVHGLNATIGATLSAFADGMKGLKLARKDVRLSGEGFDLQAALQSSVLAHVSDSYANSTRVERLIQHTASAQPALDLMATFQDHIKGIAGSVIGTEMISAMQRLVTNKATRKDVEKLAASGIGFVDEHGVVDDAMIRRMVDQYHQHGLETGKLKVANTDLWHDDPHAAELFQTALGKQIRTTIAGGVTPGEVPTWMTSEWGSLLSQYRSYGFTAMHRILIPGLQQRDRQFLLGAVAMVGLGLVVDRMQSTARGEDYDNKPWMAKLIGAIDRSGLLGWAMDVNNGIEGASFGHIGLRPSLGVGGPGDLNHAVSSITGPSGSTAINLIHSMFGNPFDRGTRQAQLRLMPLHNIWQTKALMNHITTEQAHRGEGPPLQ